MANPISLSRISGQEQKAPDSGRIQQAKARLCGSLHPRRGELGDSESGCLLGHLSAKKRRGQLFHSCLGVILTGTVPPYGSSSDQMSLCPGPTWWPGLLGSSSMTSSPWPGCLGVVAASRQPCNCLSSHFSSCPVSNKLAGNCSIRAHTVVPASWPGPKLWRRQSHERLQQCSPACHPLLHTGHQTWWP